MTRLARGHRPRGGYTLIELIVTIVILGIAGSLVLPTISSANVLRVHAAVRTVVADITFAQSDALAYQGRRAVVFDVENNTYTVVEVTGPVLDPEADALYDPSRPDQRMREDFSDRDFGDARLVEADFDGDAALIFDELGGPVQTPDGDAPSSGGSVLISGSGQVFRVSVEAYTGRVRVERISGP